MYIRHVDEDEQKIEMYLHSNPDRTVEEQMSHLLKGMLAHLSGVSKLPKQQAMDALSLFAHHLILAAEGMSGGTNQPPNLN